MILKNEDMIKELDKQIDSVKAESNEYARTHAYQLITNKDFMNQIAITDGQLKLKDEQLVNEQKENHSNRNENNELRYDNKVFNDEIRKHLLVITELNEINKTVNLFIVQYFQLVCEVQQFIEEDDAIREKLNRREAMVDRLQENEI